MLDDIFPLLFAAGLGYLAAQRRWFRRKEIDGLARFVFLIAIPAMLLHSLASNPLGSEFQFSLLLAFYLPTWVLFGLIAWLARAYFVFSFPRTAVLALAATFGNTALIGLPVLFAAFGPPALLPVLLIVSFQATSLFLLTSLIAEAGTPDRTGLASLRSSLRSLTRDPIVLSLVAGLGLNLLQIDLPSPIEGFVELLGQAALPCALFVLGANLQRYRLRQDLRSVLVLAAIKNLVHPCLVWLAVRYVFELSELWSQIAVLTAAMPTGVNAYILAEKYGVAQETVASTVWVSSLASIFTISAWIYWL